MVWENTNNEKRKREKPNSLRVKPTINFRSDLTPETLGYIKNLAINRQKTQFINQSIEMRFFMITNKRGFLRQVLEYNYNLCRYLLRKIGREIKNNEIKRSKMIKKTRFW